MRLSRRSGRRPRAHWTYSRTCVGRIESSRSPRSTRSRKWLKVALLELRAANNRRPSVASAAPQRGRQRHHQGLELTVIGVEFAPASRVANRSWGAPVSARQPARRRRALRRCLPMSASPSGHSAS
jgi:hypothetical protein